MFDIGFLELLLIFVVALFVLGPERLPYVARTIGHWIGKIKRSIAGVQLEVERELRLEEMRQEAEARAKQLEKEMNLEAMQAKMENSIQPPLKTNADGGHDYEPLPRAEEAELSVQGQKATAQDQIEEVAAQASDSRQNPSSENKESSADAKSK